MPLGHVSLPTGPSHYKEMRDFYKTILKPIGYTVFMEKEGNVCGLHTMMGGPDFWLHCGGEDFPKVVNPASASLAAGEQVEKKKVGGRTHVGFNVSSRKQVDEWYRNALCVLSSVL
jgi:hypothetical protein